MTTCKIRSYNTAYIAKIQMKSIYNLNLDNLWQISVSVKRLKIYICNIQTQVVHL